MVIGRLFEPINSPQTYVQPVAHTGMFGSIICSTTVFIHIMFPAALDTSLKFQKLHTFHTGLRPLRLSSLIRLLGNFLPLTHEQRQSVRLQDRDASRPTKVDQVNGETDADIQGEPHCRLVLLGVWMSGTLSTVIAEDPKSIRGTTWQALHQIVTSVGDAICKDYRTKRSRSQHFDQNPKTA